MTALGLLLLGAGVVLMFAAWRNVSPITLVLDAFGATRSTPPFRDGPVPR